MRKTGLEVVPKGQAINERVVSPRKKRRSTCWPNRQYWSRCQTWSSAVQARFENQNSST